MIGKKFAMRKTGGNFDEKNIPSKELHKLSVSSSKTMCSIDGRV